MTEKEKFLAWCTDQVKNHGLKSCRPYLNPNRPLETTEEDIYREMNEINAAISNGKVRNLSDLEI
jgi:hypothetical protein